MDQLKPKSPVSPFLSRQSISLTLRAFASYVTSFKSRERTPNSRSREPAPAVQDSLSVLGKTPWIKLTRG